MVYVYKSPSSGFVLVPFRSSPRRNDPYEASFTMCDAPFPVRRNLAFGGGHIKFCCVDIVRFDWSRQPAAPPTKHT